MGGRNTFIVTMKREREREKEDYSSVLELVEAHWR